MKKYNKLYFVKENFYAGRFYAMLDLAQSKNKRILQVLAEGLMKKNMVPESCSKLVFF